MVISKWRRRCCEYGGSEKWQWRQSLACGGSGKSRRRRDGALSSAQQPSAWWRRVAKKMKIICNARKSTSMAYRSGAATALCKTPLYMCLAVAGMAIWQRWQNGNRRRHQHQRKMAAHRRKAILVISAAASISGVVIEEGESIKMKRRDEASWPTCRHGVYVISITHRWACSSGEI